MIPFGRIRRTADQLEKLVGGHFPDEHPLPLELDFPSSQSRRVLAVFKYLSFGHVLAQQRPSLSGNRTVGKLLDEFLVQSNRGLVVHRLGSLEDYLVLRRTQPLQLVERSLRVTGLLLVSLQRSRQFENLHLQSLDLLFLGLEGRLERPHLVSQLPPMASVAASASPSKRSSCSAMEMVSSVETGA